MNEKLNEIYQKNLKELPDKLCSCGQGEIRDIFGIPWPRCVYLEDYSLCRKDEQEK